MCLFVILVGLTVTSFQTKTSDSANVHNKHTFSKVAHIPFDVFLIINRFVRLDGKSEFNNSH